MTARLFRSSDRRARLIAVTEAGERLLAQAREVVAGIHGEVLAALPERERAAFVDGLVRLAEGRLSTPVRCERPPRRRAPRLAPS